MGGGGRSATKNGDSWTEESSGFLSAYSLSLLKPALGWNRYRDTNLIPTNPMADGLATTPVMYVIA